MTLLSRGHFAYLPLLLACVPSVAQTGSGSPRGVVTDPSGSVIPNVAVQVSNGQNAARVARTDLQGQYRINALTPGSYSIHAEASGFAPFEQLVRKVTEEEVREAARAHTPPDADQRV